MRERRGKRKLYYTDGIKGNCDYNMYNDYFIVLCCTRFKYILLNYFGLLYTGCKYLLFSLLNIAVILTSFITIPALVLYDKNEILKEYPDIDYKNYKDNS